MTFEQGLIAAVVALTTAIVTLFGVVRLQTKNAQTREDKIRDQCRSDCKRLEDSLAESRREFTRILYRLADIENDC